jgi:acyl phosphate:glycerol-3-phosphate acyltransferase
MTSILLLFLGYLGGSLPFSIWVTRHVKGVDLRDAGSGHATTTNTIRQAGFGWGALVLILDLAKGFLPTYLAVKYSGDLWVIAATAAFAVIGHCWPIFAQFRGGMGLATFGGATLALVRHSARATVFAALAVAPILWVFDIRDVTFWAAVLGGIVIAIRFLIDWNRTYRELWLDREKVG